MSIGITRFLTLGVALTLFSFLGIILNRRNIIITFISIEMMLLAINFIFIVESTFLDDFLGQLFVIFFLTIGASESALGLGILSTYFTIHSHIDPFF
jgi:NADH-quinone oxidoreductase subunit K